ncbi:MAG: flagellar basal body P-ring formation chaperone FlgA, partial [Planctomycetota bacterium]
KELYYPSQSAARVRAELVKHEGNQAIVEIRVELDGRVLASARLEYRKGVEVRRVVAVTDLSSGTPLTARNVRFESVIVYEDPKNYPAEPFGQMVNRAVPAGGEITADLLDKIEKKVLIRRNQPVVMEISTPSYTIRASGLALQDGKSGDLIQVRNTDSKSIVVARVRFDGTLVPVLQEGQKQ